jgi:two-component system, OmpR family, phosphate regulon response regulator PhoB
MKLILVVEDDEHVATALEMVLRGQYQVFLASTAAEGLRLARSREPDLILLDRGLPDEDGVEFCRRIRADQRLFRVPIVMITGRFEPSQRVDGLEAGADDYLGKPFNREELFARIRARLRRQKIDRTGSDSISVGNLRLEPRTMSVFVAGQKVFLTPFEFRMLRYLAERPGEVIDRARFLSDLWPDSLVEPRTVDAHVARLRRKIAKFDGQLRTVHRIGYVLKLPVEARTL